MATADGAIGWDDEVSYTDEGSEGREEFVVLPPGEYGFVVSKMERGKYNGGKNLPPCNMVKVEMIVDGGDKGKAYVYHRFYMHTKCLWQIYGFLTSVGLHKHGEGSGPIPWNKVTKGTSGRCKLKVHEYDGKKNNEVDKWVDPPKDEPAKPAKPSGDDW